MSASRIFREAPMLSSPPEGIMFAAVNGTRLFYQTRGQGTPMLLMHGGLGLDHTYFLPWFDPLCARMELVYYDHRMNGRSERPKDPSGITHQTWIADADALREALGYDRIILFGHSYGGALALEYALEYGDRLAGLILCCTAPKFDYLDIILENANARGTAAQLKAIDAVLSGTVTEDADWRKMWMTYLPLYFKDYDPAIGAAMDRQTIYSAAAQNHANACCLPSFDTLGDLSRITTPTLVISGREDWITPPAQAWERIHAGMPNSESFVFEESGHFPFIEETNRFMKLVGSWTAGLRDATGRHLVPNPVQAA
jgi:proline iminopeptidase